MAIPFIYSIRSVRARWASNVVAVLGIAGVVAVFVAMLAMAKGFQATLVDSGSEGNAIVRRGGRAVGDGQHRHPGPVEGDFRRPRRGPRPGRELPW